MQIEAKAPIAEKKQGKQKHLGNMLGIEKGSSLQNCHKQTGKKNGSQPSSAFCSSWKKSFLLLINGGYILNSIVHHLKAPDGMTGQTVLRQVPGILNV